MHRIPRRDSLVSQTADILRENLRTGAWRGCLPGENALCDLLKISRTTLRKALKILQREGLVASSQGQRRRIIAAAKRMPKAVGSRVIGLLSAAPLQSLSPYMVFHLSELRRHLQDAGYELRVRAQALFHLRKPGPALEKAMSEPRVAGWILFQSSPEIQRWFAERDLPVIVSGSCHEGIRMPSYDVHYQAVCRHAVGVFLGLGHRRIAFLLPKTVRAGDLVSEHGFREGFETNRHPEAMPLVVHHDATIQGIRDVMESLLNSHVPPTGVLVANPRHVLTVFSHVLGQGRRVPADLGLVSRDYDQFLEDVIPTMACYKLNHDLYAGHLARLVVRLATTGVLPPQPTRIMPRFQRGGSLGPVPG